MSNLGTFANLVYRAQELGVFDAFSVRYKKLRRQGVAPHHAGARALREAADERPLKAGQILARRVGRA